MPIFNRAEYINKSDSTVICTAFSNRRRHDFGLFKESKVRLNENIKVLADSRFQGIGKFHKNSEIPKKKTNKHPLTDAEKSNNRKISSELELFLKISKPQKTFYS